MSYFGVSNPELDAPLSGMRAARRGRARAQRRRVSHSQMAGRNGGFADPREIMAYHNKGELSDGATIQALSLFGIGAAGAHRMIGESHRAKQQAAMMGLRRQQASLRGFAGTVNQLGSTHTAPMVYDDSRGGSWRIEYGLDNKYGSTEIYKYIPKSLDDSTVILPAKSVTYQAQGGGYPDGPAVKRLIMNESRNDIENYVASLPVEIDDDEIIVDGSSDAFEGGETDGDGGEATGGSNGGSNGGQSNINDISNLSFDTLNAVRDAFLAGSITYGQAQVYIQTHFSAILYNQTEIDDFLLIEMDYTYTNPGLPRDLYDYEIRDGVNTPTKYREATPASDWKIVTIKKGENKFSWGATSTNFPEANLSSESFSTTSEAAKQQAIQYIDASVENYHSSKDILNFFDEEEETVVNGNGGNGNGVETDGNGSGVTVVEGYDNDTDVIDGYKLGVIGYLEAFNTLVLQFNYSENEATEALRTESSSNDYYIPDTDGDAFRETEPVVTPPLVVQEDEVVSVPSGSFIEENKVALAGGALLVAGAAAMAYSNRRN